MKDIVIIKLYHNVQDGDWHDLQLDEVESRMAHLISYGNSIGKHIMLSVLAHDAVGEFMCFAEISYTGTVSESEQAYYNELLQFLSCDGYWQGDCLANIPTIDYIVYIPLPTGATVISCVDK